MKNRTYKVDNVNVSFTCEYSIYDNISKSDICYTKSKAAAEHICKLLNKLTKLEAANTYKKKTR
jgi:hypothetical protein